MNELEVPCSPEPPSESQLATAHGEGVGQSDPCFAYVVFLFVFCLTLRTIYKGNFYDRYSYMVVLGGFFAPISKCFEKAH